MGNSNDKNAASITKNWQRLGDQTMINVITDELIDQHSIWSINEQQRQKIIKNCRLRINKSHLSIIKLIYYKNVNSNGLLCQQNKNFQTLIYTENMEGLLFKKTPQSNVNLQMANNQPCYCKQLLNACCYLAQHYGHFEVQQTQIWLTKNKTPQFKPKLKVWINSNPALCQPNKPSSQQQMVNSLMQLLCKLTIRGLCKLNSFNLNQNQQNNKILTITELLQKLANTHKKSTISNHSDRTIVSTPTINTHKPVILPLYYQPSPTSSSSYFPNKTTDPFKLPKSSAKPTQQICTTQTNYKYLCKNGYSSPNSKTHNHLSYSKQFTFYYPNQIVQNANHQPIPLKISNPQRCNNQCKYQTNCHSQNKQNKQVKNSQIFEIIKEQDQSKLGYSNFNQSTSIQKINENIMENTKQTSSYIKQNQNQKQSAVANKATSTDTNHKKDITEQIQIEGEIMLDQLTSNGKSKPDYKSSINQKKIAKSTPDEEYNQYMQKYQQVKHDQDQHQLQYKKEYKDMQNNRREVGIRNQKKQISNYNDKNIKQIKTNRDKIQENDTIWQTNSETNRLYKQIIRKQKEEAIAIENTYKKPPYKQMMEYKNYEGIKLQKYKMERNLERDKKIIREEMQNIMVNCGLQEHQIKEKIKHKKASFAELKAQALKILDDYDK